MDLSKSVGRAVLGVTFILAGFNHFWNPTFYRAMMPPYIPSAALMVDLSGYAEILLGVLVFIPRAWWAARYGLIALLIAIFPANLHMALNAQDYPTIPAWVLWLRLPFQPLFIAWVLWCVVPPTPQKGEIISGR